MINIDMKLHMIDQMPRYTMFRTRIFFVIQPFLLRIALKLMTTRFIYVSDFIS